MSGSRFHSAEVRLVTERLQLRELGAGDEAFILELVNEPAFLANIGDRGIRDEIGAERYINDGPRASYARHGFGLYCVALRESGERVGMCGLLKRDTLPDADIGFAFLERHRGRGYAIEAAKATVQQARELGLPRLLAITVETNYSSRRLLEKLGMHFEKIVQLGSDATPLQLYAIELAGERRLPPGA